MPPEKPEDAKRDAVVNAIMNHRERLRWRYLRFSLNLETPEATDRLTELLAMHLALDSALTALLSARLVDPRTFPGLEKIEGIIGRIQFSRRVDLAKAAGLIASTCATALIEVNTVRTKFAHCQPKDSTGRVGLVPELSSGEAFERCMDSGESALNELNGILIEQMVEPVTLSEPPAASQ